MNLLYINELHKPFKHCLLSTINSKFTQKILLFLNKKNLNYLRK